MKFALKSEIDEQALEIEKVKEFCNKFKKELQENNIRVTEIDEFMRRSLRFF